MCRIRIRNFGPIKEGCIENDGWMELSKTVVFIGNQGSGKSTVAKLISTFFWIEKSLVRGDFDPKWFSDNIDKFRTVFLKYHRLENYLSPDTRIDYEGDSFGIYYFRGQLIYSKLNINNKYSIPQIMYVPSERNFLSYVRYSKELALSSDAFQDFLTVFNKAKLLKKPLSLPINHVELVYDRLNDLLSIQSEEFSYKLKLMEASSGFQSVVPLILVSEYLSYVVGKKDDAFSKMNAKQKKIFEERVNAIYSNNDLTLEQQRIALSSLSSQFNKDSFINIVEEPEQNLFPTSQWQVLERLLKINNSIVANKLIITTHSPYVISSISLAMQAGYLKTKIKGNDALLDRLNKIVNLDATLSNKEVSIYELDEASGEISLLDQSSGVPSDSNKLNHYLAESNELFDSLLEIEQAL